MMKRLELRAPRAVQKNSNSIQVPGFNFIDKNGPGK